MRINVRKQIELAELERSTVARKLWPTAKKPLDALRRVEEGTSELNEGQIRKLSYLTGQDYTSIFNNTWKPRYDPRNHTHLFNRKDGWSARVDNNSMTITVMHDGSDQIEEVLYDPMASVASVLERIDGIIDTFECNQ